VNNIRLFWWSPRRDPKLAYREMRSNGATWARLAMTTGKPLCNFGDELSPLLVSKVLGRRVRWSSADKADLVAVGSVIEYVAKRTRNAPVVWGTGIRDHIGPEMRERVRSQVGGFLAVRGRRSIGELGLDPATPIGDPGVLAPDLIRGAKTRRGILYLPHFRTWSTDAGRVSLKRAEAAGMAVMAPAVRPEEAVERISGADLVLTSSLHGLIVAHAFGVPAQLISPPESRIREPEFKYLDYLESVGLPHHVMSIEGVLSNGALEQILESRAAEASGVRERSRAMADSLASALGEFS